MSSVISINGSAVGRPGAHLTLDRLDLSMDGNGSLAFTEHAIAAGNGTFHEGQTCVLTVDSVQVFSGRIVSATPLNIGTGPIDVGYRALDLRYLANLIPITATDGTGVLTYNFPSSEPDYVSARAGKSVGAILKAVFDLHSAALSAIGITGYTSSELSAITVVPTEPVVLSGRLWSAAESLLTQWCNKYAIWIDGAGLIHVVNTISGLTAKTLTLDTDPVILGSISRDHSESFTQVVARGGADVQGAYLRLTLDSLHDPSTSGDRATWSIEDYYQPRDASDTGSITSMTSTTITVSSDVAARTWGTNFWSDQSATLWVENSSATDITFQEMRQVIACDAMSAGGSAMITVDIPFDNSGYDKYVLRGNRTELSMVYRKYTIPNTYIAQHLQQRFNHSVPFTTTGAVVAQTWAATAVVCWSTSGSPPYNEFPATLQVVPYDGVTDGYIVFDQPTVFAFNSKEDLEAGGASVKAPDEIVVLIPYSRGALTATKPSSGYEGTAYTVDGVERTLTLDYPSWLDGRNSTQMQTLAQEVLDTVKDTVVEGSITYLGKFSDALSLGLSLNIARAGGTTGWESLNAPVRSVSLVWPRSGANLWETTLNFSTRRRPFSGDRLYVHPAFGQVGAFEGSLDYQGPIGGLAVGFEGAQSSMASADDFDVSGLAVQQHSVRSGPTDAQKAAYKALPDQIGETKKAPKSAARIASEEQDRATNRETVATDQGENARRSEESRGRAAAPDPALAGEGGQMRNPAQDDTERVNRDQRENAQRLASRKSSRAKRPTNQIDSDDHNPYQDQLAEND